MSRQSSSAPSMRIGIDLGGTKISGILMSDDGKVWHKLRRPTPRQDYTATLAAIMAMITELADRAPNGEAITVGIGTPGSLSPVTGVMQNANSTWLNGRALGEDLAKQLTYPLRLANDANCFALSEAHDGAAAGAKSVFGVILGTGCGGGLVWQGEIIDGPQGIGGEWGHNPLPWPISDELPGPACWCGRYGCIESWVSGPALAADHARVTGATEMSAEDILARANAGDAAAQATLDRHLDRLARALASVVNLFDPHVIVLGGGLSNMRHLYDGLPEKMRPHIFSDSPQVRILPPRHGDDSGVRGAARLWSPSQRVSTAPRHTF